MLRRSQEGTEASVTPGSSLPLSACSIENVGRDVRDGFQIESRAFISIRSSGLLTGVSDACRSEMRRATCLMVMPTTRAEEAMVRMHGAATLDRRWPEASSEPRVRPLPRDGDILASKRTARADVYMISIVPSTEYQSVRRHSDAIETVRTLARQLRVDGWFTCDHTHFARIVVHRPQRLTPTAAPTDSVQNHSF